MPFSLPSTEAILQAGGLLGAFCYVANYARLTFGHATADQASYFALNLVAACLVLASLVHAFNAAGLVIQTFFLTMSTVGLCTRLRRGRARRMRPRPAAPASGGRSASGGEPLPAP